MDQAYIEVKGNEVEFHGCSLEDVIALVAVKVDEFVKEFVAEQQRALESLAANSPRLGYSGEEIQWSRKYSN